MKTRNLLRVLSSKLFQSLKLWKRSDITLVLYSMLLTPLLFLGEGLGVRCSAQNVGISATGVNPDNSAMLDVTSNTKGMLIPRMTGDEKYAIPSPATGLLIFQTDTVGFWYYDGTKWIPLVSSTSSTASPSNAGWLTTGNISTAGNDFLGTRNNTSLRMRTNNGERMVIDSFGRVGISTYPFSQQGFSPQALFHVAADKDATYDSSFVVTSAGNVGIGTTTPAYKLDILNNNSAGSGVTSATLNLSQTRTANITAATNANGINNSLLYRMTEASPLLGVGYAANNVAYTDGAYTFNALIGAYNQAYITGTASTTWYQLFGSINRSYLNSAGTLSNGYGGRNQCDNSGSGTITNATGSHNIVQNISTTGGSITQAIGVQSYITKAATASAIGTGYLYYGNYGSGAATNHYGLYITGEDTNYFSGKVGIGTASPKCALSFGATLAPFTISGGAVRTDSKILLYDLDANNWSGLGSDASGNFWLKTSTGATYNYLTMLAQTGNVGIGTTAPSEKLEVCGNLKVIGTINASSTINASQAITCSSDIRYKKDITPLSHALSNVMKLQGVNYHWKAKEFPEKQFTEGNQIGFIAQELEKIIPEVVLTDKDGYKSVDYSRLTPVLVEAIKEQQKKIDSMQLTIAKLEASMSLLLQQRTTAEAKK